MPVFQRLRELGVLGINARNALYTLRENPRRLYPVVDDKLRTKALCERAGIPVPGLLAVARYHFEIPALLERIRSLESFAVKPARGAMGNGILVVGGRSEGVWQRAAGRAIEIEEIRYHVAGIISGLYALGGHRDEALVEERLSIHPALGEIAIEGVPDVRVIVYRGVPVMAMIRLPTRASGGRANLHQGAIGAGIDLASGRTLRAVLRNRPIGSHVDSGRPVVGVPIPAFDRVLEIATRAATETGLGYVGADVVIDERRGPLILELNARPGLAIQVATGAGLRPRLERVRELPTREMPLA
ncbi:MAG: alpha-L-glutamate ligase-like protein, partial [Nitrospirae bacterium]